MNVEELSMIGPNVDLATVDSIHKKRLLAFINHFVISTSSFLNKLSKSCEQRFMVLENKIQKLEASIIILESKLNSVPNLEFEKPNSPTVLEVPEVPVVPIAKESTESEKKVVEEENIPVIVAEPEKPTIDPEHMRYVKMLQFGVPPQAVRMKMSQEGVDPSLFEDILNFNK